MSRPLNFNICWVKGYTHCLRAPLRGQGSLSRPRLQDRGVAGVSRQPPAEARPGPVQDPSLAGLRQGRAGQGRGGAGVRRRQPTW